ncbi:beta-ketoacyl-ACP synthase 3 [Conexibacter sp. SYSU D00693]|uniref:beta-ketoacyl-ACP synthase 3 n=1 Tax=Conexibacter sp. SYSU D00693 TaxID=2812560 RepID=UPI00196B3A4B|nr:beta-ketoacyl-ACP synthase 3 [Conexibacter sp. SYSU D00693]
MHWHSAVIEEGASVTDLRSVHAARLAGLGAALPDERITNGPVAAAIGVDETWIARRTGIDERRRAGEGVGTTDLAEHAARAALDDAGVSASEVDLVVVATMTPDRVTPSVAPVLAARLGTHGAAAYDVWAACTGWLTALTTAAAQLETGRAQCALVVGAERLTSILAPADKMTTPLFGDGAAAAVLTANGEGGRLGPVVLGSDGTGADLIACEVGGRLTMDGHETFRRAVSAMTGAARRVCDRAGIELQDVDLVVPHQANARITAAVADRLGLPADRIVDDIAQTGNTSAATIPLALARAKAAGRLPDPGRVLVCAFGAGLTWGAALLEWEAAA